MTIADGKHCAEANKAMNSLSLQIPGPVDEDTGFLKGAGYLYKFSGRRYSGSAESSGPFRDPCPGDTCGAITPGDGYLPFRKP